MVTKEKIKSIDISKIKDLTQVFQWFQTHFWRGLMILQLPVEEINQLIHEITETIETKDFMKLAETGFQEWNDPEEDIYNNEAKN